MTPAEYAAWRMNAWSWFVSLLSHSKRKDALEERNQIASELAILRYVSQRLHNPEMLTGKYAAWHCWLLEVTEVYNRYSNPDDKEGRRLKLEALERRDALPVGRAELAVWSKG